MARRTITQCDGCGKFTDRPLTEVGKTAEPYQGQIRLSDISVCPDCLSQSKIVAQAIRLYGATQEELAVGVPW